MGGFFLNQPDEYFTDIEAEISKQRGKRYTANPVDWAMIEAWKDRGMPVHLILRVIQRQTKINSLSYFRREVEAEYEKWLPTQVGQTQETYVPEPPCGICGKEICFSLHREG